MFEDSDFDDGDNDAGLQELIEGVIFKQGWSRYLVCEAIDDHGQVFRIRRRIGGVESDFNETDVVGFYTTQDYHDKKFSLNSVKFDCQSFLRKKLA